MRRIVIPLLLILAGCGGSAPEAMFEDYIGRLANLTGIEAEAASPPPVAPYPRPRDLVLDMEDIRVNPMTFLKMGECGLLGKISERNSPLGRLQRETGRLLYELDFYRQIRTCEDRIGSIRGRNNAGDFLAEVAAIRQAKAQNLPRAYWNATFAAPEFRAFMATATEPLQRDEPVSIARFEQPIRYLAALGARLESAPAIAPAEFEQHYFQLQADKTGGKIVRALNVGSFYLHRSAELLEAAAQANRICPMGRKTQRADYLFNVFVKFYAGGVQPYVSRVHQAGGVLVESLSTLKDSQRAAVPPAFESYYAETLDPAADAALWGRYNAAIGRHTKAWQAVLKPCGMMPTGPVGE